MGLALEDEQLDNHVEQFPLVALVEVEGDIQGFLFGSLERIGGTPCILWGLGAVRKGRNARPTLDGLVAELYRRAAISFPDEDVLVAGRVAHPGAYSLFAVLDDVCPRPKYSPNGEERAWGRRLARRFGCDARYDDRTLPPERPRRARAGAARRGGQGWAARSWSSSSGEARPRQRRGAHRLRLGDGRGARRRPRHPRS